MNLPEPQFHYDARAAHCAAAPMPVPGTMMPVLGPYDHHTYQPQQNASHITLPQPSLSAHPQAHMSPYPPSDPFSYPPTTTPVFGSNNGFLAVPQMGHSSQASTSTCVASTGDYDCSRPSTPHSAMTTAFVASEQSHNAGYQKSGAMSNRPTKPQAGNTPGHTQPTGLHDSSDDHGSCCCVIM